MDDDTFHQYSNIDLQDFHDSFQKQWRTVGPLIVSAVIDDQNGFQNALKSFRDWFVETERFSEDWIKIMDAAIRNSLNHVEGVNH